MAKLSQYNNQEGVLCLYSSDAEVFDFRPRRYGNEGNREGEWLRIRKLLESIQLETDGLTLPSNIIEDFKKNGPNLLQLESYWQPITVKSRINIISIDGLLLAEMIFL